MKEMKNKKITSRNIDFAKWYTDIVLNAHLAAYSSVKGCMVLEPNGYAIWENCQSILDGEFKKLGHKNVYMPLFIPESLLQKETEHVEGFAPEVAWVTHGGQSKLEEKMCIRPTSETLFCDYYSSVVKSYRDLPKLYNQWCSVVRWEKETRPFLRTREFLWQEGHTLHETSIEAEKETMQMLEVYKNFFEKVLAIPVITGKKTEKEKFAGAEYTLTVEALMYNGITLQSATSHYFGQNFTKPFDIKFSNRQNELEYAYQTSWGTTTRMIGALIMVHSDDNGLVLPPKIAVQKVAIIPIGKEQSIYEEAKKIEDVLKKSNISCEIDITDKSPGFKFAEAEMLGIPVRIEMGSRDLEKREVILARRDTGEKKSVSIDKVKEEVENLLEEIQKNLYETALKRNLEKTYICHSMEEIEEVMTKQPGYIKASWCGDVECELKIKEIKGTKSRCIPFKEEKHSENCVCCGRPSKHMVYFGIQY